MLGAGIIDGTSLSFVTLTCIKLQRQFYAMTGGSNVFVFLAARRGYNVLDFGSLDAPSAIPVGSTVGTISMGARHYYVNGSVVNREYGS